MLQQSRIILELLYILPLTIPHLGGRRGRPSWGSSAWWGSWTSSSWSAAAASPRCWPCPAAPAAASWWSSPSPPGGCSDSAAAPPPAPSTGTPADKTVLSSKKGLMDVNIFQTGSQRSLSIPSRCFQVCGVRAEALRAVAYTFSSLD